VREAWPEAAEEILAHTRVVVPLTERGTVSYSLPDRPGTSYINVTGKSLVDLADDLLHETAHHRLHSLEEIAGPLDRDDGEPRYHSPWRHSVRPLHGILHATYTFMWRAELLRRLLDVADRGGTPAGRSRSWLQRELDNELKALRGALHDLLDAGRLGLLTRPGLALGRALARRIDRIYERTRRPSSSRASLRSV
jgi:HEXXH motif-containing protein